MLRRFVLLLAAALPVACSSPGNLPQVRRSACMATAEAYRNHVWHPTEANVFHGTDPDGILVHTPDAGHRPSGAVPGWWIPGSANTGMPYQWGGFDTPAEFDRKIAAGKAAGDVYTLQKRALLDAGVSRHAAGIDCSGFVSRCWNLPRSFSTREFASICEPLPSWDDLQPGDILNTWNAHVTLFGGWADSDRSRLIAYEAGIPPWWLVVRHTVSTAELKAKGFKPMRYRGMTDG